MAHRCFLAYLILTFYSVAGQSPKYVLKGNETSLTPAITGLPDDILWKHNDNKVVEFSGWEEAVFDPFKNRITLDRHSAELKISDLRFEDSGRYDCEVYVNEKFHPSYYELEVIDKVAKPTISCKMNDGSSSDISGTLMCSAEPRQPQSLTRFEWNSSGKHAQQLTIPLGGKHDDEVYSCSVSNPLSRETATFTAKDCYPEKTSVALTVSLVIIISVILLVGIVLWTQRRKVQACLAPAPPAPRGTTEDETTENEEKRPLFKAAPTVEEHDGDGQDAMPKKGHVQERRKIFEPAGTKCRSTVFAKNKDKQGETVRPPVSSHSESASPDERAEKDVPQCEPSDSERANEPDPAADSGEDESEKKAKDEKEVKSPFANDIAPTAQEPLALNHDLPNMGTQDLTGEHKEEAISDEANGETADNERDGDGQGAMPKKGHVQERRKVYEPEENKNLSTVFVSGQDKKAKENEEAKSPPSTPTQQHLNLNQNLSNMGTQDPTGEHEEEAISDEANGKADKKCTGVVKSNESDSSSEDIRSSIPEQENSPHEQDSDLEQEETQTSEAN